MHELLSMLIVFGCPVAILATVFNYKLKRQQLAQGGAGNSDTARLKAHCDELEARLQTLETIICEGDVNAAARLRAGAAGAIAAAASPKLLTHTKPQPDAAPATPPDASKEFR